MTWLQYLTHPAVNWSSLKHMEDSPKHYKYHIEHGRKDTPQLAIGRYVHAAVLQPETLDQDFAIWTGDRRGNKWKNFVAENADKTIFKQSEIDDIEPIIEALRPVVAPFLTNTAEVEQTILWTDPTTGIQCKARPDLRDPKARIVAEIKTTNSADIRRFGHDVARYKYHGQAAHYRAGIIYGLGWTPAEHILIVVESKPPYDTGIFPFAEDALEVGRELVESLLARLKECTETNHWPGRHPKPVTLGSDNLPPWIFGGGTPDISWSEDP